MAEKEEEVKPEHYVVKYPVSSVYKPEYSSSANVSYGNYRKWKDAEGFFTPCEAIEGKAFRILDVSTARESYDNYIYFTLLDADMNVVIWKNQELNSEDYSFPCIIVSYLEKVRSVFTGREFFPPKKNNFYAQDLGNEGEYTLLPPDSKLKCVDVSLTGRKNEYLLPKLILEDESGGLYAIDFIRAPRLNFYLQSQSDLFYDIEKKLPVFSADYFADGKIPSGTVWVRASRLRTAEEVYEELAREEEKRQLAEEKRLLEEKRQAEEREEYVRTLTRKYGSGNAKLILEGKVRIGMTKQMCIEAWGEPSDINKTTGPWGVHEQWVYGWTTYLYFENGKLTTIQN